MTDARLFIAAGNARQPQRLVVGEGASVDAVQASGAWIAADPAGVREVRR